MSYAELYAHCQSLGPKVSRRAVYPKVLALTRVNQIRHVKSTLDTSSCRGMYLSAENLSSRFVQQVGSRVIVTARELNYCWERFVYVKELMHAFDNPMEATDSGEEFDILLQELSGPPAPTVSAQAESEFKCFWMALGALCPEGLRTTYAAKMAANETDHFTIATELRIPEAYVPRLFESRYVDNVSHLIGRKI